MLAGALMKNLFVAALIILFAVTFISCSSEPVWEGVFDYYPEKPEPGDEITVFYNADSSRLSSYNEIEMVAYLYSDNLDDAVSVEMKKVQNGWEGKLIQQKRHAVLLLNSGMMIILITTIKRGM